MSAEEVTLDPCRVNAYDASDTRPRIWAGGVRPVGEARDVGAERRTGVMDWTGTARRRRRRKKMSRPPAMRSVTRPVTNPATTGTTVDVRVVAATAAGDADVLAAM